MKILPALSLACPIPTAVGIAGRRANGRMPNEWTGLGRTGEASGIRQDHPEDLKGKRMGIAANAKAFEMAQTFSVEQGLSKRKQPWDEIFPREVMYSEERL